MNLSGAKIVLVRPGALGDAVLTLPVLHALRQAGARSLTLLGTPRSWAFLNKTTWIEHLEDLGAARWLGLFAPGLALDAQAGSTIEDMSLAILYLGSGSEVTAEALRRAGVRQVLAADPPKQGAAGGAHAARRLLDALAPVVDATVRQTAWAAAHERLAGDPFLALAKEDAHAVMQRLGLDGQRPFLAIHPGSGGRAKCWPAERFAELASSAEGDVLLLSGPADAEARAAFLTQWKDMKPRARLHQADGLPLRDVLALLSGSRAYVGNDSGVTHLAARACPTLALFGPTDPEVWKPLGPRVRVVRAANACIADLSVPTVRSELASLLESLSAEALA